MKKWLIGIVILAFVVLTAVASMAATFESFDVEATLEWTIFDETDGLMPGAKYGAPAITIPDLTLSSGSWSASTKDANIVYTTELATLGLYAATSYAIFDLENDIAKAQGVTLAADIAPISIDGVYTSGGGYGVGGAYTGDSVTLGAKYNSTGAYGVSLVGSLTPLTLTGQYASGPAYLVKGEYALTAGTVTLQYKMASASQEISAALADIPVTGTTLVAASVTSKGGSTTVKGTTATTLAEGVTLTLDVASTAGVLTYSGKIGVSL